MGYEKIDYNKLNKWQKALGLVYDQLCELEMSASSKLTREEYIQLSNCIDYCKYWKQPEFNERFSQDS